MNTNVICVQLLLVKKITFILSVLKQIHALYVSFVSLSENEAKYGYASTDVVNLKCLSRNKI